MAFTKIGSVGVRAGSIHVTRVISFTFVNIWETTYIFALHYVCHFKNERNLSRVITLIIIHNKTVFLFFVFYKLDIWNVYFITNISVYQAIGSETTDWFLLLPQNVPSTQHRSSCRTFIYRSFSQFSGDIIHAGFCKNELETTDLLYFRMVSQHLKMFTTLVNRSKVRSVT